MPAVAQEKSLMKESKKVTMQIMNEACDLGISNPGILPVNSRGTLVDADGWKSAGVSKIYDRQTQGSVYPMAVVHDDGFIGCTWTNEDCEPFEGEGSTPLRGVAYSYSTDGGLTWSWNINDETTQENRIGGIPLYWPSYAQWGKHGEVVLARSADTYEYNGIQIVNGLVLLTRETKGEGDWTITPLPYPEGTSDATGYVMAWARMTTSGPNHEYIHIISPMSQPTANAYFPDYTIPNFYYRTQDGKTWDVEGALVPEMVNNPSWTDSYSDVISFAVQGNTVAASFMKFGSNGYVIRSRDNGDTWESIKFWDNPVNYDYTLADYSDTVYAPNNGCVALDNNGKIHLAFSVVMVLNSDTDGSISVFRGFLTSFLSYWNEDMPMVDGDALCRKDRIQPTLYEEYFDLNYPDEERFYVYSKVPKWPVIGYYTPKDDEHLMLIDPNIVMEWAASAYGSAGSFAFPQMAFDKNNKLHLVYLGLLDDGQQGEHWLRHPFYTTTADEGTTWTETEYPVNFVGVINQEFAYLTLAGPYDDKMYLMAQTDPYAGVFTGYGTPPVVDHPASNNNFTVFNLDDFPTPPPPPPGIDGIGTTSFPMIVQPNPASGQATVKFAGKGNITVYNMLGQVVYHVENVENQKDIPLNMASGVYFVTVRSGNATATQKLVVK